MNNSTQKYEGIAIYWRSPTIKVSRGKKYPSLDIRNSPIDKMLSSAAKYRLCAVFMYTLRKAVYFIKVQPEFSQRTTLSCKYGTPFEAENVKKLINNEEPEYCVMDSNPKLR